MKSKHLNHFFCKVSKICQRFRNVARINSVNKYFLKAESIEDFESFLTKTSVSTLRSRFQYRQSLKGEVAKEKYIFTWVQFKGID